MSKKKPQNEAAAEGGMPPPAAFSEASAAPDETAAAAPDETAAAAPDETAAAAPDETAAAAPGETTTEAPAKTHTDHGYLLLDIMFHYNCDKVWVNNKGEVFVDENLANLSVNQQKKRLKVYTKSQIESLKAN
jgi:hypothetical protein